MTPPVFQGPASPVDVPDRRYAFHVQDTSMFSDNWGAAVNIERVSDKQYSEDFGDSLTTSATALLGSSAYLNGRGTRWNASFGADASQITQVTLSNAVQPYMRLPRATFAGEHALLGGLAWGVNAEYVDFRRGPFDLTGATPGSVLSVDSLERPARGCIPLSGLSGRSRWLLHPPGTGRTLHRLRPAQSRRIQRIQPGPAIHQHDAIAQHAGLRPRRRPGLRPPADLVRHDADADPGAAPVLPARAVSQPGRPADLRHAVAELRLSSLFRSNTFVGADRQSNANNLTLALTSRLIDAASGDELLSASIGQIHYFSPQRGTVAGRAGDEHSGSDYVAELDLRLNDRWQLKWDQQYNPNSRCPGSADADAGGKPAPHRPFRDQRAASFRRRRHGEFLVPFPPRPARTGRCCAVSINANWSLVGRYYYSLMHNQLLEAFAGAQYDSCCVAMRVLVRHYINVIGQLKPVTESYASNSSSRAWAAPARAPVISLRRAILGYQ